MDTDADGTFTFLGYTRDGVTMTRTPVSNGDDPADLSPSQRTHVSHARRYLARFGLEMTVRRTAPTWQPGDVVVLRYGGPRSKPWTYVRGRLDWPGDRVRKTDAEMTAEYRAGRAVLVMRNGEPVSP